MKLFRMQQVLFVLGWLCIALATPTSLTALLAVGLVAKPLFQISSRRWFFAATSCAFASAFAVRLSWMFSSTYHGFLIFAVAALLALIIGMQFALFFMLCKKIQNSLSLLSFALSMAALWVLIEMSREALLCGFPLHYVGMDLAQTAFKVFASVGGVYLLSYIVMVSNLIVLASPRAQLGKSWVSFLIVLFLGYTGLLGYAKSQTKQLGKSFNVMCLQTGWDIKEKMPFSRASLSQWLSPTDQALKIVAMLPELNDESIDLIVLPESSIYPSAYANVIEIKRVVDALKRKFPQHPLPQHLPADLKATPFHFFQLVARVFNADIIAGLDVYDPKKQTSHNSAFLFSPTTLDVQRYDKRILLPLAEALPFNFLKVVAKRYGITNFYEPGNKDNILKGRYQYGLAICYEEYFSSFLQRAASKADLLVTIANGAWFPFGTLPHDQHFHGSLRAVELGMPMVRVNNTGMTSLINSFGKTVKLLPSMRFYRNYYQGALISKLPLATWRTPFSVWGLWIIGSVIVSSFFVAAFELVLAFLLVSKKPTARMS